jgi:DNA-directed RNA polymerase subunit RPC12/RpoP
MSNIPIEPLLNSIFIGALALIPVVWIIRKIFSRVYQTRFDNCSDVVIERCSRCHKVVGLSVENIIQMEIDTGDRCPHCDCLIEHGKR